MNVKKIFSPYYVLFFLTIMLILLIIIFNYKFHYSFDPDYIKTLSWNKRSSYIKQREILSKLKNKQFYTEKDLILINQLISISNVLKDNKTFKYAQKLKFDFLFNSLKDFSNSSYLFTFTKDMSLNEKIVTYLLSKNEKYLEAVLKESSEKEKMLFLYMLNLFFPEKIQNFYKYFTKTEIDNIKLIIEYINIKGE
ncbi:hypothetical protein SAMN02745164_00046 [Marinitoga hydrogenitolerans DSM 16785]|uniref:Uncharacterized protein n=1 Tax=Marinitoga hydrogenitolerans (strain DSM 16785 / JCM 12826 / AT1271) TaxID=1122195 RepID=A0A1M4S5A9_MARH1|nr:hypothetical protein [Marinitoga hydrogenitolerans]SHE27394.1 hypothetical protein SAMN02745164_00046 [Marinitoga hydrogenitolerans DSM 16785]